MWQRAGLLVVMLAQTNAMAGSEVFVCTDASGTRTYQNTGPSDQCRKLNVNPVLTIPQPTQRPRATAPATFTDALPGNAANPSAGASMRPSVPPVSGQQPAVGGNTAPGTALREPQGSRDADRLRILESELRDEERRLQSLQQRQFSAPEPRLNDDIARSQASLDALRREIAKARRP